MAGQNKNPGGLFENNSLVADLTIGKDLSEIEDLKNFVIQSNDSGQIIRLNDVAEIKFDLKKLQSGSIFESKDALFSLPS